MKTHVKRRSFIFLILLATFFSQAVAQIQIAHPNFEKVQCDYPACMSYSYVTALAKNLDSAQEVILPEFLFLLSKTEEEEIFWDTGFNPPGVPEVGFRGNTFEIVNLIQDFGVPVVSTNVMGDSKSSWNMEKLCQIVENKQISRFVAFEEVVSLETPRDQKSQFKFFDNLLSDWKPSFPSTKEGSVVISSGFGYCVDPINNWMSFFDVSGRQNGHAMVVLGKKIVNNKTKSFYISDPLKYGVFEMTPPFSENSYCIFQAYFVKGIKEVEDFQKSQNAYAAICNKPWIAKSINFIKQLSLERENIIKTDLSHLSDENLSRLAHIQTRLFMGGFDYEMRSDVISMIQKLYEINDRRFPLYIEQLYSWLASNMSTYPSGILLSRLYEAICLNVAESKEYSDLARTFSDFQKPLPISCLNFFHPERMFVDSRYIKAPNRKISLLKLLRRKYVGELHWLSSQRLTLENIFTDLTDLWISDSKTFDDHLIKLSSENPNYFKQLSLEFDLLYSFLRNTPTIAKLVLEEPDRVRPYLISAFGEKRTNDLLTQ